MKIFNIEQILSQQLNNNVIKTQEVTQTVASFSIENTLQEGVILC